MPTAYELLPLFAQIAVDRLHMDGALRTVEQLNALLDAYAKTYGQACDDPTRRAAYSVAARRFLMPALQVAA